VNTSVLAVLVLAVVACFVVKTDVVDRRLPAVGHVARSEPSQAAPGHQALFTAFDVFSDAAATGRVFVDSLALVAFGLALLLAARLLRRSHGRSPGATARPVQHAEMPRLRVADGPRASG
jgi:hypothetical protein